MGLFGKDPVVDADVRMVLLTQDRRSLKAAEKLQQTLRPLVKPDEKIELVAVGTDDTAIAVIGTRVYLFVAGPRVLHEVPLVAINAVSQTPSRMNTTFLEGALNLDLVPKSQWPWSPFASDHTAHEVCVRINRMILSARPRSIRKLNPGYYEEILVKAGKPLTREWMDEVAFWIAFVVGGAVAACLGTNPNPRLFDEFLRRFSPVAEGNDHLDLADDIIDWAWASHPILHEPLVKKVDRHRGGAEIGALKHDEPTSPDGQRERNAMFRGGCSVTFETQKLYAYIPI